MSNKYRDVVDGDELMVEPYESSLTSMYHRDDDPREVIFKYLVIQHEHWKKQTAIEVSVKKMRTVESTMCFCGSSRCPSAIEFSLKKTKELFAMDSQARARKRGSIFS